MSWPILSVRIKSEQDIVVARQLARQITGLLGFDVQDQTRLATAVSEIARNAFSYAGGGKVEFRIEGQTAPQLLLVRIKDQGPGMADVHSILAGQYRSKTGLGLGIVSAQRLVDQFELESSPDQGTTVWLKKLLPKKAPTITADGLQQIANQLAEQRRQGPLAEVQQQNRELLYALEELRQRQEDLIHLNHELEDTNRGVVALYAELDEKADHLRQADEMKSHFLSNMSHEFRTPLNSILALSRLLLDRTDGELTSEQEKQVYFIRKSAGDLLELVNDLLDLAKIEAGKIVVQPVEFQVAELFSALRGMLRPLLLNESVNLVFEEPEGMPPLYTDESKVSQILRNFISNALKFTPRGEVRVSAVLTPDGGKVIFSVADSGIGIASEDQAHIFEEFTQLDNPLQQRIKGTGLGLPLCRKLASLLNGNVAVESQLGLGSTFSAVLPICYSERPPAPEVILESLPLDPQATPNLLVIDDEATARYLLKKMLAETPYHIDEAADGLEGLRRARQEQPQAIFLDLMMPGMSGFEVLEQLKADPVTKTIPVIIISSKSLTEEERRQLTEHTEIVLSKETLSPEIVLDIVKKVMSSERQALQSLQNSRGDGDGYNSP